MFNGVRPGNFWLPMLDQGYVAKRIVSSIRQEEAVVLLPWILNVNYFLRAFLPTTWLDTMAYVLGFDSEMDNFTGRQLAAK